MSLTKDLITQTHKDYGFVSLSEDDADYVIK